MGRQRLLAMGPSIELLGSSLKTFDRARYTSHTGKTTRYLQLQKCEKNIKSKKDEYAHQLQIIQNKTEALKKDNEEKLQNMKEAEEAENKKSLKRSNTSTRRQSKIARNATSMYQKPTCEDIDTFVRVSSQINEDEKWVIFYIHLVVFRKENL